MGGSTSAKDLFGTYLERCVVLLPPDLYRVRCEAPFGRRVFLAATRTQLEIAPEGDRRDGAKIAHDTVVHVPHQWPARPQQ